MKKIVANKINLVAGTINKKNNLTIDKTSDYYFLVNPLYVHELLNSDPENFPKIEKTVLNQKRQNFVEFYKTCSQRGNIEHPFYNTELLYYSPFVHMLDDNLIEETLNNKQEDAQEKSRIQRLGTSNTYTSDAVLITPTKKTTFHFLSDEQSVCNFLILVSSKGRVFSGHFNPAQILGVENVGNIDGKKFVNEKVSTFLKSFEPDETLIYEHNFYNLCCLSTPIEAILYEEAKSKDRNFLDLFGSFRFSSESIKKNEKNTKNLFINLSIYFEENKLIININSASHKTFPFFQYHDIFDSHKGSRTWENALLDDLDQLKLTRLPSSTFKYLYDMPMDKILLLLISNVK